MVCAQFLHGVRTVRAQCMRHTGTLPAKPVHSADKDCFHYHPRKEWEGGLQHLYFKTNHHIHVRAQSGPQKFFPAPFAPSSCGLVCRHWATDLQKRQGLVSTDRGQQWGHPRKTNNKALLTHQGSMTSINDVGQGGGQYLHLVQAPVSSQGQP
jgi:hypothetical protein